MPDWGSPCSASNSRVARCAEQYHLRQCFLLLDSLIVKKPEMMTVAVNARFNEAGDLADETTNELMAILRAPIAPRRKVQAG